MSKPLSISIETLNMIHVGRMHTNDIVLNNKNVSGMHCNIFKKDNEWFVADLKSTNGTWVSDKRIEDMVPFTDGTTVRIMEYKLIRNGDVIEVYGDPDTISSNRAQQNKPEVQTNSTQSFSAEYPYFTKSPRMLDALPSGKIEIDPAPDIMQKPEFRWASIILPVVLMTAIGIGVGFMTIWLSIPMMLSGVVISIINYNSQKRKHKKENKLLHDKYEGYLKDKRNELLDAATKQKELLNKKDTAPASCADKAIRRDRTLWERLSDDDDFASFRIGQGALPGCIEVRVPKSGFTLHEKEYQQSPQKIADEFAMTQGLPIVVDMRAFPTLGVVGNRDSVLSQVRAIVTQAVTNCGYDELRTIFVFSPDKYQDWSWTRWLPHVWDEREESRRLIYDSFTAGNVLSALETEISKRAQSEKTFSMRGSAAPVPFYLFVIDDMSLMDGQPIDSLLLSNRSELGVGVILTGSSVSQLPKETKGIITASGYNSVFTERGRATEDIRFTQDNISVYECDLYARALAPVTLPKKTGMSSMPKSVTFMEGYGIEKPEQLNLEELWANSRPEQSMAVPIGIRGNGKPFAFDINEKAHGPHGLVAGTTGSGKSEMIQSWILSMAIQFPPELVSFVLIDFKGTGLILPFQELPHLAGTISDLDVNISRNLLALRAELDRRKTLFDRSGTHDIKEYMNAYRQGKVSEPLSYLFVVIDEYAEFKVQFPEFTVEVDTLFRTGRALGVHIIVLTQDPSGIISPQSENNIKFRWCLSVASAAASKEVLGGHPDAAGLSNPGRAYVRIGNDEFFEPVQSFWSGAPYKVGGTEKPKKENVKVSTVALNGARISHEAKPESHHTISRGTEIMAMVKYLKEYSEKKRIPSARPIWNSKLPYVIPLPELLENEHTENKDNLAPIVGLIDDPWNQRQVPFRLRLSEEGHAVIYGIPGSGKTTFVQSLILSLCMSHTAEEVNIHCMDFGGWTLSMFKNFPQVGEVANSNDGERIKRLAGYITDILDQRKNSFAREGVGSIQAYNRAVSEPVPYVVLVIDNFVPVLQLYPELDEFLTKLTREGSSYGVYLVATTNNNMGLGYRLQQNIRTNITLQLSMQSDYSGIIGRTEGLYPENNVGRGLVKNGRVMEFQTAIPGNEIDDGRRSSEIRALADSIRANWHGEIAGKMQTMPDIVEFGSVASKGGLPLGLDTRTIAPVELPIMNPHTLMISGFPGSGKTNLLKVLLREISEVDGIKIGVCGNVQEFSAFNNAENISVFGASGLDDYMTGFSSELQRRKNAEQAGENTDFEPIALFIDNMNFVLEEINGDTLRRLTALATMGAGLNAMLIVSFDSELLGRRRGLVPMLGTMADRQAVVLGGRISDHSVSAQSLSYETKSDVMAPYEGYYFGEKIIKFKSIKSND